jgi:hypothetical protein
MFTKILAGILSLSCLLSASSQAASVQGTKPAPALEPIVIAHYASWYVGQDGGWFNWVGGKKIRPAYTPLLGFYDVRQPATLSQHIAWANAYGVDAFMITWDGNPTETFPLSNEHTVKLFLDNPDFKKIKFFFVYGVNTALRKKGEVVDSPVDIDDEARVAKFIADMKFAAAKYFNQPNHLKVQAKPVLYVWATGWLRGDIKKALARVRTAVKSQCWIDLFIIADEIGWGATPVLSRTIAWDAVMPYIMLKPQNPLRNYKLEDSISEIVSQYHFWTNVCADLGIGFVPEVLPGENARGAPWLYDAHGKLTVPVIIRSPAAFKKIIQSVKPLIDPDLRLFFITSWNEWNEGTNIEPAREFRYDYLDVVRKNLKTFLPADPPQNILKFAFKRVWDPGEGDRVLAAAFDWIKFLDGAGKTLLTLDIGTPKARPYLGMGWSYDEQGMGGAKTYIWAVDRQKYATIHLDLPAGTKTIRFKAFQVDPPQSITVLLDSRRIGSFPVQSPFEWVDYDVDVPSASTASVTRSSNTCPGRNGRGTRPAKSG